MMLEFMSTLFGLGNRLFLSEIRFTIQFARRIRVGYTADFFMRPFLNAEIYVYCTSE